MQVKTVSELLLDDYKLAGVLQVVVPVKPKEAICLLVDWGVMGAVLFDETLQKYYCLFLYRKATTLDIEYPLQTKQDRYDTLEEAVSVLTELHEKHKSEGNVAQADYNHKHIRLTLI